MKYKTLNNSPKIRDVPLIKIIEKDKFLEDCHLIPLLVCNQYRIYSDQFKDLKLLRYKKWP
jgi:hypothetical protein